MLLSSLRQGVFVSLLLMVTCASAQQCTSALQCYPTGYVAGGIEVPPTFINCSADGECVCRNCFSLQDVGTCAVDAPCRTYDTTNGTCLDHRRSQVTALVLAIVLTPIGAANFYVARYEYAVPQLVLFVILIASSLFGRILRCFSEDKGRETESFLALCSTVVAAVVAILALLTILAWWIADVVMFAKNTRRDGSNCLLREDL